MERWLTYDNISLIPTQVSELSSRREADTGVQFGPIKLGLPLIASPMPDVTNGEMAKKLRNLGSFGWVHRFQTEKKQKNELLGPDNWLAAPSLQGVAIPAKTTTVGDFYELGVRIFCIDTANGANKMVEKTIKRLKDDYPEIFIVAGNVASLEGFQALEDWGADAIRVGIAGGSVCETRTETAVYSPMASAILNIADYYKPKLSQSGWHSYYDIVRVPKKALLIADGGIKEPSHFCKALALGADLVMAGGIFAGTKEAPGDPINTGTPESPKLVKLMRGAASYSVQNGKSEYVEGRETFVPYKGSVERVINRYAAGLRSSMSYMNAQTLEEYRRNVKIVSI